MITKNTIRTIETKLKEITKKSKDIQFNHEPYSYQTIIKINPTKRNAHLIAEMIDFLGDFDWGEVEDLQGAEFYKYDEIWYHSIDTRISPYSDEMAKYEDTYFYEIVLEF